VVWNFNTKVLSRRVMFGRHGNQSAKQLCDLFSSYTRKKTSHTCYKCYIEVHDVM